MNIVSCQSWWPPVLAPAVLEGNSRSSQLLGRCQPPQFHLPPTSFSWQLCPPSISLQPAEHLPSISFPDSVSSVDLASSTEVLLPASHWLSSWKLKPVAEHLALRCMESVLHLCSCHILSLMAGFCINVATSLITALRAKEKEQDAHRTSQWLCSYFNSFAIDQVNFNIGLDISGNLVPSLWDCL